MICGSCIDRPEVEVCPQCRIVLTGKLSRNRVLENIARKIFPEETVIDHVTTQEGIDEVTAQETNEIAASENVPRVRLPTYDYMGFPYYGYEY